MIEGISAIFVEHNPFEMRKVPCLIGFLFLVSPCAAQFGPQQVIESNETRRPLSLVSLDVDGDGILDLVASLQMDNRIVWYKNSGGTFGEQRILVDDTWYINKLIVEDVDLNGLPDLVGVSITTDQLQWWPNMGSGVFGSGQTIALTHDQPRVFMATDVDNDGLTDYIIANYTGGTLQMVRSLGAMQFSAIETIDTPGWGVRTIEGADIDGDGLQDIVTGRMGISESEVAWYRNLGEGNFSTRNVLYLGLDTIQSAGVADLNNDGNPDIYSSTYINNSVDVYFNNGSGEFGAATTIDSGPDGIELIVSTDMDMDGITDLVFSTYPAGSVKWLRNDGSGLFTFGGSITSFAKGVRSILSADLNGDGDPDLAYCSYTDSRIAWHSNEGGGLFGPQQEITTQVDGPMGVSTGDLDGDGDLDVLCASFADGHVSWYENDGDGSFAPQRSIANVVDARCAVVADIDLDGDPDVLVASRITNSIFTFLNDGSGAFTGPQVVSTTANLVTDLKFADLDLDGDQDLVAQGESYLACFLNTGDGTFEEPYLFTGDVSGSLPFDLVDLDGNGLLDVVHTTSGYSALAWFRNLGGGSFSSQIMIDESVSSGPTPIGADIDRDGDQDLVLGVGFVLIWYSNNGNGTFAPPSSFGGEGSVPDAMVVYDVDGDGYVDVITASTNSDQIAMYRNLGNGNFASRLVIAEYSSARILHAANLDANPSLDLLCASWMDDLLFWHKNYFGSRFRAMGRRYIDMDLDGVPDADEPGMSNGLVSCAPDLNYAITSENGSYRFELDSGTYHIATQGQGQLWDLTSEPFYDVSLTGTAPVAAGLDFGYVANVDTSLIIPTLVLGNGPCGSMVPLWLTYTNQGTRREQGTITMQLDSAFSFGSSSPPPDVQTEYLLSWDFDSLDFFESRTIALVVQRPGFGSMGEPFTNTMVIVTTDGAGAIAGTLQTESSGTVACSYDPNDKQVEPIGYGALGAVPINTNSLSYTIRFQNTGTAPAWTVSLNDQLPAFLDRSRLEVLGYSHQPSSVNINANGELEVRFESIFLPTRDTDPLGSQGFVKFRVGVLGEPPHLTQITNTAAIHFDFNPPIITNTTLTTLVDCDLWTPLISNPQNDLLEATEGDAYQWYLNGEPMLGQTGRWLMLDALGSYQVEVTSIYGCTAFSDATQIIALSLVDHERNSIVLVPNPFSQQTRLVYTEPLTSNHAIDLIDVHGRLVRRMVGNGSKELLIERGGLSPGLYTVLVRSGTGTQQGVARLVVE